MTSAPTMVRHESRMRHALLAMCLCLLGGVPLFGADDPHSGTGASDVIVDGKTVKQILAERGLLTPTPLVKPIAGKTGVEGDGGVRPLAAGESGLLSANGRVELLFLRVCFPDDLTEYCTEPEANAMMETVNQWYVECSYNQMQITTTVTPLLLMPHNWHWYHESVPTDDADLPGVFDLVGDACAEAAKLGYNPGNFSLITTRHRGGMFAGWTGLGGGGLTWLKATDAGVQAHEIGHAIGLGHSDSWGTGGRGTLGASDASGGYSYANEVQAYGDIYDCMGSGYPGHFNPLQKAALGWLGGEFIQDASHNGKYRVYAFDTTELVPGRKYALTIPKNDQQTYWAGMRAGEAPLQAFMRSGDNGKWNKNSLMMWMAPWDSQREKTKKPYPMAPCLLDTTPGSPDGKHDGGIAQGRTYEDPQSHLYITVVDLVQTEPQALDVVVNYGPFPSNRAPSMSLLCERRETTTRQIMIDAKQTLKFTVSATDPDGDVMAYHWDFGDNQNASQNRSEMTYSWNDPGLYTVRCVVSDMKGGTASMSLAINVGLPEWPGLDKNDTEGRHRFYARGCIVDQAGNPMPNVRVWVSGSNPYRGTFTDTDGSYILSNVDPGQNDGVVISCYVDGWHFAGVDTASPIPGSTVPFKYNDIDEVNFVAYKRNQVSAVPAQATIAENAGTTTYFRVRRQMPSPVLIDDVQVRDYLSESDVFVRLYISNGAGATLKTNYPNWLRQNNNGQWYLDGAYDANGAAAGLGHTMDPAWVDIKVMNEVISLNPEYLGQVRNHETCIVEDHGPYVNIRGDSFVIIPRGYDYVDIQVTPVDDSAITGNRDVSVLVAYSPDYWSDDDQQTIIVTDDDMVPVDPALGPANVWLEVVDSRATESGVDKATIAVHRDGPAQDSLTVNLTVGGSATAGTDYQTLPASVTIPAGQHMVTFDIIGLPDQILEVNETAVVSLGAPTTSAYTLTGSSATAVIADNPRLGLTVTNTTGPAHESRNNKTESGYFTITRVGPLDTNLKVYFSFPAAGAAGAAAIKPATPGIDFTAKAGDTPLTVTSPTPLVATIPAGQTSIRIEVVPSNDAEVEGDENVTIVLEPSLAYDVANPGRANLVICDSKLPYVTVETNDGGTTESQASGGNISRFIFKRYGGDKKQPLLAYYTVSGEADAGVDYSIATQSLGTVYFGPDIETVTANFTAFDDTVDEDAERVYVNLLPRNPATPFGGTMTYNADKTKDVAVITIEDNDGGIPVVMFEKSTLQVVEGNSGSTSFTVDVILSRWPTGSEVWQDEHNNPNPLYHDEFCIYADYTIEKDTRAGVTTAATPDTESASEADFTFHDSNILWNGASAPQIRNVIYPGGYDPLLPDNYVPVRNHDLNIGQTGQPGTGHYGTRLVPGGTLWFPGQGPSDSNQFKSPNNILRRRFTFTVNGDTRIEPNETFLIKLKWPRNCKVPEVVQGGVPRDVCVVTILDDDSGSLALSAPDATATESGDPATDTATVELTRTGDTAKSQEVYIELAGSAVPLRDYIILNETLVVEEGEDSLMLKTTLAPGETSKTFTIAPIDDAYPEISENITFRIWKADGATFNSGAGTSVSIADNDTFAKPVVTVGFASDEADLAREGGGPAVLTFRRAGGNMADPLTVTYDVSQLSTAGSDDYGGLGGSVTFPANQGTVTVSVSATDDVSPEDTETAIVAITTSEDYIVQTGPRASAMGAIVSIIDNDRALPVVAIRPEIPTVVENQAHEVGRFVLTRSKDAIGTLTVTYTLTGNASNGGDYTAIGTSSVTFGYDEDQTVIDIHPIADATQEGEEDVVITLVAVAGSYEVDPLAAAASVTIVDDEAPSIRVTASTPLAVEQASPVAGAFTLTRSGGNTTQALTVTYAMSSTAVNGTDYQALSGSVIFGANVTSVTVPLTPIDDATAEVDEPALMTVNDGPAGAWFARAGQASATVTILDDDRNRVSVATTVSPAKEKDTVTSLPVNGVFTLTRTGSTASALTVRYRLSGTAVRGDDYASTYVANQDYGEAVFAASAATTTVSIAPVDDSLVEVDETVAIELLADANNLYNLDADAVTDELILVSDDITLVTVEASSDYAKKGMEPAPVFIVRRFGSTYGPLRVNYAMGGDADAINGTDYDLLPEYVDFRDGEDMVEVPLVAKSDVKRKVVTMTIVNPIARLGSYMPSNPTSASMTLLASADVALQVVAVDDKAVESTGDTALLQIQRSGGTDLLFSVSMWLGGTATENIDYRWMVPVGSTAAFAAGTTTLDFLVQPMADILTEDDETVAITVAPSTSDPPAWFLINHGTASVRIVDAPDRTITVEVLDQTGAVFAANTYSPEVDPADGDHGVVGNAHEFSGLVGNRVYDILMDPDSVTLLRDLISPFLSR